MSSAQNSDETTTATVGRPFPKGVSGNPGGRPKGLAKATREAVGEDELVGFWLKVMNDEAAPLNQRLEASRLLGDRGWGKAQDLKPIDEDGLGLGDTEQAAARFRAEVVRLADKQRDGLGHACTR